MNPTLRETDGVTEVIDTDKDDKVIGTIEDGDFKPNAPAYGRKPVKDAVKILIQQEAIKDAAKVDPDPEPEEVNEEAPEVGDDHLLTIERLKEDKKALQEKVDAYEVLLSKGESLSSDKPKAKTFDIDYTDAPKCDPLLGNQDPVFAKWLWDACPEAAKEWNCPSLEEIEAQESSED